MSDLHALVSVVATVFGGLASLVSALADGEKLTWLKRIASKKWWKRVLVFAVAALTATGFTIGGYKFAERPGRMVQLGGVDLNWYCTSYGLDEARKLNCESRINLGDACDWRWREHGMHMKMSDSSDPHSGKCYTASGRNTKKGVDDLPGYCQDKYQMASKVIDADPAASGRWVCRTSIDPSLVCNWRYQSRDVVARLIDQKWVCFKEQRH